MPQIKDIRTFQGIMNQDIDPRFIKAGDYIDALNIRPDKQGGSFETMEQLYHYAASSSDYTCIGLYADEINDHLYWFGTSASNPDLIRQYQIYTDTWVTIVSDNALAFSATKPILSFDVTEGFVFFTDGVNPPRIIDLSFDYTAVGSLDETYFNMAKVVPRSQPTINVLADSLYKSNNIIGKFFQFKHRFVFSNKQRSVFSPISDVAYSSDDYASPQVAGDTTGKNNAIDITLTGDGVMEFVTGIEVAGRSGNHGDFFLIKKIDPTGTFLSGGAQTFRFYNEGLYSPISLQESNQLFDDVPKIARALTFINNRVVLGDVTTGYDKIDVEYSMNVVYGNAIEPSEQTVTQTNRTSLEDGTAWAGNIANGDDLETYFGTGGGSGFNYDTLREGDSIRAVGFATGSTWLYSFGDVTITVRAGEDWGDIVTRLVDNTFDHPYTPGNYLIGLLDTADGDVGNTGFEFYLTQFNHVETFKSGAWYNVALQYFDGEGRTNGTQIQEDSKVYIKTLGERSLTPDSWAGAGAADIEVTIISLPPSWAKYYKIVYSKANVYDFNLQLRGYQCQNVGDNVKIDISTIGDFNNDQGGNLNYVYEKGDMVRIFTYYSVGVSDIKNNWVNKLIEAEIVSADSEYDSGDGRYSITIPQINYGGTILDETTLDRSPVLEIYRNSKEIEVDEAIFNEASMFHEISGGYHEGDTNQTSSVDAEVTIYGDAYMQNIDNFPYWSGAQEEKEGMMIESYEISVYRDSRHYSKGRPSAIINQEEDRRIATLMYSEKVIPNTDINNLNRFYPDVNFEEYNRSFGNVVVLSNEGDHILMLQHDKTSKIYVDKDIMYNNQGQSQLVGTQNSVLSSSMPYTGEYGIQNAHAFTHFGNRKYWVDRIRGIAVRLSQNGIEEISRYGMTTWFNSRCSSASEDGDRITATYDPFNDEVLFSFIDPNTLNAKNSIVFSEHKNGFTNRLSYDIRYSASINNRLYLIGSDLRYLYRKDYALFPSNDNHNKIGTTDLDAPFIQFASNVEPDKLKNYLSVHIDGVYPMDVLVETIDNIRVANQETTMLEGDFHRRETEWHSPVFRDVNTPNVTYPIISGDTMKGKHAVIKATITDSYYNSRLGRWTSIGVIVSEG